MSNQLVKALGGARLQQLPPEVIQSLARHGRTLRVTIATDPTVDFVGIQPVADKSPVDPDKVWIQISAASYQALRDIRRELRRSSREGGRAISLPVALDYVVQEYGRRDQPAGTV